MGEGADLVGSLRGASHSVVTIGVCGVEVENKYKLPPFCYDDFVALRLCRKELVRFSAASLEGRQYSNFDLH